MNTKYAPALPLDELTTMLQQGEIETVFEAIAQPLHEELYKRQDFNFLDELQTVERTIIAFDYVQNQAGQGGFIQLIQNGYISLLVTVIEGLQEMKIDPEMIKTLDNALKVYVLNREMLDKETSVEEFSKLYEEFKEFEILDKQFIGQLQNTKKDIATYYLAH